MNAVFRPGKRVGRYVERLCAPSRGRYCAVLCVGLLIAASMLPAHASVLYRCTGPHGELAYVSHTHGYTHCEKVGAWATPVAQQVSQHHTRPRHRQSSGSVLPGKPPRPVKANPAILKVMPLGSASSIKVQALPPPRRVWEPLPVSALAILGSKVLPVLLGVGSTAAPPALPATVAPPPSPAAAPIPLKLDASLPKPPRRGAVYRVVKKNGTVLYTNVASLAHGRHARKLFTYIVECYACDVHSKIDWHTVPLHLADYRGDVRAAAKLTGVNAALLRAVIHAESGFNPDAVSQKGAEGLMQLMPEVAFTLGVGDAFNPGENISGGARYLAALLHDYHGDVKLAAAAYNAGPTAVAKYKGVPPYAETRVYVKRVAVLYQRYRKALADHTAVSLATAAHAD